MAVNSVYFYFVSIKPNRGPIGEERRESIKKSVDDIRHGNEFYLLLHVQGQHDPDCLYFRTFFFILLMFNKLFNQVQHHASHEGVRWVVTG